MTDDTGIGGRRPKFPTTQISAVLAVRAGDPVARARAFAILVNAYWKPVYKNVRLKWHKSNEEAKDLTQGFFATAFEKNFFSSYDPHKARFRTFLRTCLDRYVSNAQKAGRRIKRGGDAVIVSLDFDEAEAELSRAGPTTDTEQIFDREWARALLGMGVEALKAHLAASGKATHFRIFERYDLGDERAERPTYAEVAKELGISVTDVTNHLALARREFRRLVLENLRAITATEEEFREEARTVLGVDVEVDLDAGAH